MIDRAFCTEYFSTIISDSHISGAIDYSKDDVISMLDEYGVPNVSKLTDNDLRYYFNKYIKRP